VTAGRNITDVVKIVNLPGGEEVAAVRCGQNRCGIVVNGLLLESIEWRDDQIDDCLAFLDRFARTTSFPDDKPDDQGT
jgi:hypothetical protein